MDNKIQGIEKKTSIHLLSPRDGKVLSWRFIAVLSLMGCITIEILFNLLPVDHNTLLLYWFFPASLLLVSQLYFNLLFTNQFEIKLLLAFFVWAFISVLMNFRRAQLVDSYEWFASTCITVFLCCSLPYAFTKGGAHKVFTLLAITTVLSATLLSVLSLIAIYGKEIAAKAPTVFEGIGIAGGRLSIDNHPNRSATGLATAVILTVYLFQNSDRLWKRISWALCGAVCFVPLALTVSRTAILATGLGVSLEVFLMIQVSLREKSRVLARWILSILTAALVIVALYQGAMLIGQVSNKLLSRFETASVAQAQQDAGKVSAFSEDTEIDKNKGSISIARDLSDADSFNGRTDIWINVWHGLVKNPIILAFGTGPRMASHAMAQYFPANSPIGLFHNSLLGTLVSFGVLGLFLILLFIAFVAVSAFNLSFIDIKNADTLAIRMIPAMLLFTLAEGMMEDFLFSYNSINIVWLWFMISAGFVMRLRRNGPETRD